MLEVITRTKKLKNNSQHMSNKEYFLANVANRSLATRGSLRDLTLTEEQHAIVDAISHHKNVICSSRAGCGKSSSALACVEFNSHLNFLILTYNAGLKSDTREKACQKMLTNVEIESFHSFGFNHYSESCMRDEGLRDVILSNQSPTKNFMYDVIIIDEIQDMSRLFYLFVLKIIRDGTSSETRLFLCGDEYQCIYKFKGTDARFLKLGRMLYPMIQGEWINLTSNTSFRITNQISIFINKCMSPNRIKAIQRANEKKVQYRIMSPFDFGDEIISLITSGKYKPSDIYLLSYSVKGGKRSPIQVLERKINALRKKGQEIQVYVSSSDESKLDPDIIEDKIVITTFHKTKGLERKVVVVYGFDDSYYAYYNKDGLEQPDRCPNLLYVAVTRAKELLYLIHDVDRGFLPFLNHDKIGKIADVLVDESIIIKGIPCVTPTNFICNENDSPISVSDVVKYNDTFEMKTLLDSIPFTRENLPTEHIRLPTKIHTDEKHSEEVFDINGIAIPAIFEYRTKGKSSLYETIENGMKEKKIFLHEFYDRFREIDKKNITTEDFLFLANLLLAKINGTYFKASQIKRYDWLDDEEVNKAMVILKSHISNKSIYEVTVSEENEYRRSLCGCIDAYDPETNTIWEIKCVNKFSEENILQIILYAYIVKFSNCSIPKNANYRIINITTGEVIKIEIGDLSSVNSFIESKLSKHHKTTSLLGDREFLKKMDFAFGKAGLASASASQHVCVASDRFAGPEKNQHPAITKLYLMWLIINTTRHHYLQESQ